MAISYGAYRHNSRKVQPTISEIKEDLKIMAAMGIKVLRTYNVHFPHAENILKASKLDSTIAELYYFQATKNVWTDFNWEKGRLNFEKALKLRPNYPDAMGLYSHFLMNMNQWKEARELMNKALDTDPNNPFVQSLNAMVLLNEEKYEMCIQKCESLEKIMPNNPLVTLGLFFSYANISISGA